MEANESTPERRKGQRRKSERRTIETGAANLAAAPSDHGFTITEPYVQRQLIVVVPNEVLVVEPRAFEGLKKKASASDRAEALLSAVEEETGPGAPGLSSGVEQTIRGVMAMRELGVGLRMVAAVDAAEQLSLAPGHPFHGTVYVGHPGIPATYYPFAEFHQRVFEHKFSEAVDLAMALGASQVEVEREEGFGRDEVSVVALAFNSGDAPAGPAAFKPKQSAAPKSSPKSTSLFSASFPGSDEPMMPKAMVWWKSERSWQSLAKARIRHQTAEFSLSVRYENDYGVDKALRDRVEEAGLGIGGRFHPQVDTVWTVHAEFPSPAGNGAESGEVDSAVS